MSSKVSVVIPNYNHARYLPQRIESVLNQSYANMEVLLLDDCSPDASRDVIARYAALDARIQSVLNEENSGSTFRQWNKGIALAQGEYVWLAESDDYADLGLLAALVARLDADPCVMLAYCDSWDVNEDGVAVNTWEPFLAELDPDLWKQDFTVDGAALVRKYMSYRNIIPNASAVLFRRSALLQAGPADATMKVFGDWLYWARILAMGKVAYVAQPLNYFRTHRNNVRSRTREDGTVLVETTRMLAAMRQYGAPDPIYYQKAVEMLLALWFHATVYYKVPWARHQTIYRNMMALESGFSGRMARTFGRQLFGNKFSGIRMLLGDKLLRPLQQQLK